MAMQTINVQISKTGEIQYDVAGVKGKKCKDLTKAIDEISGTILETKVTGEFCEVDPQERARYTAGNE